MSRTRKEPGITKKEPGTEWCVWYKRTTWGHGKARIYQSRGSAERNMRLLLSGRRPGIGPIEYIALRRRDVGEWQTVKRDSEIGATR